MKRPALLPYNLIGAMIPGEHRSVLKSILTDGVLKKGPKRHKGRKEQKNKGADNKHRIAVSTKTVRDVLVVLGILSFEAPKTKHLSRCKTEILQFAPARRVGKKGMFAFLRGTVAAKPRDHIALDVGGVGFAVYVPESTYRRLVVNQEALLHTYCHIREDEFKIFGFLKEEEKTLFIALLGINGVGPRAALALLSSMSVAQFGQAIMNSDVAALAKAPGIGKKLAQRIVLETRTRMGQTPELSAILGETRESEAPPEGDDVYEALISLGCTPAEARKAAATARRQLGAEARDEDLVRAALRSMARI